MYFPSNRIINKWNNLGSIYTTVAISLERYITVCHPFFKLSHNWSSNKYILPILLLCIVYNIPKYFELQVHLDDYWFIYVNVLWKCEKICKNSHWDEIENKVIKFGGNLKDSHKLIPFIFSNLEESIISTNSTFPPFVIGPTKLR